MGDRVFARAASSDNVIWGEIIAESDVTNPNIIVNFHLPSRVVVPRQFTLQEYGRSFRLVESLLNGVTVREWEYIGPDLTIQASSPAPAPGGASTNYGPPVIIISPPPHPPSGKFFSKKKFIFTLYLVLIIGFPEPLQLGDASPLDIF